MLADDGTTISDIEAVRRGHPVLFGPVASEPTARRTIEAVAADELADIRIFDALGQARANAWAAGAAPPDWDDVSVPVTIDIDATLVTAHSDKDQAKGNYKGGFGFHPLLGWLDRGDGHGEALGAILRPGNAGANHAGDNIDVLEQCLANLPAIPAGKQIIVRGDSAMATKDLCGHARKAGVKVSVSLPIGRQPRVQAAIPRALGVPRKQKAVLELDDTGMSTVDGQFTVGGAIKVRLDRLDELGRPDLKPS